VFVWFVLGVVALVHLYVYRRAVHDVFPGRRARRVGAAVLAVLGLIVMVTFALRRTLPPLDARPLHYVAYLWLAVVLYMALLLAVGELVRLVLRVVRGRADPGPA
jgi:uncharacterized protein